MVLVQLHETEHICLTDLLGTVHVKHLEGKLLEQLDVLVDELSFTHLKWSLREQHGVDTLVEGIIFELRV